MNTKQKIVILEGHDNSGKSILAAKLSTVIGIPKFHYSGLGNNFVTRYDFLLMTYYEQSVFIEFLEQTGYSVILDRCYPSEYVYEQVKNRPVDLEFIGDLDERYAKLNTKIVICRKDIFKEEFKDYYIKISEIVCIKEMYKRFAMFTECDVLQLNTTKQNLDGDIKKILKFIEV